MIRRRLCRHLRLLYVGIGLSVASGQNGLAQSANPAPVTVRLAASRSYDTLAIARAHGVIEKRLKEKNIIVQWQGPYPAMAPQIEAMNAGALDFGTGSSTAFASARAANAPIVAIGYTDTTPGYEGILVQANSTIKAAADLAGHKVAVNKGGTGEYLLLKTLEHFGLKAETVTKVYMGPSDAASAFGLGLVDAWAVWDPYVSTAQDKFQAQMLIPSTAVGTDNMTLITARKDFLTEHPETAKDVFRALQAEDTWASDHPDEAAAVWAKYVNLPLSIAKRLESHSGNKLVGVGAAQAKVLIRAATWMFEHKLIPSRPDLTGYVIDLTAGS